MKKLKTMLTGVLVALGISACAKVSPELERFQGHWVDINSDTTLDISGDKMTFTRYGYETKFTVKAEEEYGNYSLMNADKSGGFEDMSSLTEYQEGHLIAYEMVFDADGHRYEFVREEVKEEELKIKDYSTDMPKTIESDTIVEFELSFTNMGQYGLGDEWPQNCRYRWYIGEGEDGGLVCSYTETYDSYMGRSYDGPVTDEFMKNLAQCIKNAGIIEHNGYSMSNSVDGTDYSLYALYDSDEELRINAAGDAANTCVFDLKALMEVVKPLLEDAEVY